MIIFPWVVLVALVVLAAIGIVSLAARAYLRWRHAPPPFHVGLLSTLVVALPVLLAILLWGIVIKPR